MQIEHFFPQIRVKTKKKRSSSKIEHFFPQIQVKTKLKKVFIKDTTLFSPIFAQRCKLYTHSNYWGGYSQIIGVIYPPLVSAPLVTKVFNINIYAYYLSKNAVLWLCTLCKHCTYCIIVSTLQFHCSIDVTVDDLDRFDLFFCFVLRLTICPVVNFVFLHRHENSYFLFHPRFRLILFIFLVFKLIAIFFGVKAWYFYYGKCSS